MVGFEPTGAHHANGFQDRHHKPLGHISMANLRSLGRTFDIFLSPSVEPFFPELTPLGFLLGLNYNPMVLLLPNFASQLYGDPERARTVDLQRDRLAF